MKKTSDEQEETKIRLDKWLWAARFFKTRALAIKAIKQGKLLYDGHKPNPSREVRLGATITVPFGNEEKTVVIKALGAKRQSAALAQELYEEMPESIALREKNAILRQEQKWLNISAPRPQKRPDKDARRKIRTLRRQGNDEAG